MRDKDEIERMFKKVKGDVEKLFEKVKSSSKFEGYTKIHDEIEETFFSFIGLTLRKDPTKNPSKIFDRK